jgi:hypothetical protein
MSKTLNRITRLGLGFAAAGSILCAQAPRLGLTAGAAWPTGGTRDGYTSSAGYTLGAFADWERQPGHTVRLALDGVYYPSSTNAFDGTTDRDRAQSTALTLNYVFTPRADLQGFYLVLGAGGMNIQRRNADYLHETGVKLAWNAGFGINLNENWGFLARYHNVHAQSRNLGTVTAGLTYKF